MKNKFTPWNMMKIPDGWDNKHIVRTDDGIPIAEFYGQEAELSARLAAAAPDLFDTLEKLLTEINSEGSMADAYIPSDLINIAERALAKARNE